MAVSGSGSVGGSVELDCVSVGVAVDRAGVRKGSLKLCEVCASRLVSCGRAMLLISGAWFAGVDMFDAGRIGLLGVF